MRTVALTAAATLVGQNMAWAVCSDGTAFPQGGYLVGTAPIVNPANWSPNVFTAAAQGIFVPDISVNENNDPSGPFTGGGHNWVFDQGSTLCKQTDVGGTTKKTASTTSAWSIPPNNATQCIVLPVVKNGAFLNLGDIPFQGSSITPTCDPTLLTTTKQVQQEVFKNNGKPFNPPQFTTVTVPNPTGHNTYFNQLGCAVSAFYNPSRTAPGPVATTPQTAITFLFVAGIQGGMFAYPLANVGTPGSPGNTNPTEAGKVVGALNYFSSIPEGQKLTGAAVSPDGMFAVATSIRRNQQVWGCLNPLGDPGDPQGLLNPAFSPVNSAQVACMGVANNALAQDLTTIFGPDNQPYFGGQRVVTSIGSTPGGTDPSIFPTAWPHCLYAGNTLGLTLPPTPGNPSKEQADFVKIFASHSIPGGALAGGRVGGGGGGGGGGGTGGGGSGKGGTGGGGNPPPVTPPVTTGIPASQIPNMCIAQANGAMATALITQPSALISHVAPNGDGYMYSGPVGGTIVQFKVTQFPNGQTNMTGRTYLTGISLTSGIGVADDLGSLIVMTDPSAVGLAGQGVMTKLPLCEDM